VIRVVATVAAIGLLLAGCGADDDTAASGPPQRRTLVVNDNPTDLCVAVAVTEGEKLAGLSHRDSIPHGEGMAFLYDMPSQPSFTMKDTSVPLDIVWVGPEDRVITSSALAPMDETPKAAPGDILLAVELSPKDWDLLAATARTVSLGDACEGTIVAGRPGSKSSAF
jgi:uncharacterized membrane protein (UPF0127 family)